MLALLALAGSLTVWAGEAPGNADQAAVAEAAKKLPQRFENKPLVFIPLVAEAPKELKGDLSDPAWSKAAVLDFQVSLSAQPIEFKSEARVFCTADALYVGVKFDEPDTDKLKDDGAIWERDGFECFLLPGEEVKQKLYYQVIVDASGKTLVSRTHMYPKYQYRALMGNWSPKLEQATAKSKTGWSGELRITFSDLTLPKEVESKESLWRLALYRNRPGHNGEASQYYAWSPTLNNFHHTPARFGYALLAPYASEELIQKLIERGHAANKVEAEAPLAEATAKQIHQQIQKLGSEVFEERNQASAELAELMKARKNQEQYIEEALRKAETDTEDIEVRSRARKLLQNLREARDPDEDPPPENFNPAAGGPFSE